MLCDSKCLKKIFKFAYVIQNALKKCLNLLIAWEKRLLDLDKECISLHYTK